VTQKKKPQSLVRRKPWDRGNPFDTYIDHFGSEASQTTMTGELNRAARFLAGCDASDLDWAAVRREHVEKIRARLQKTVRPTTGRKALSAVKGLLKMTWSLGYTDGETFMRAVDVAPIRGHSAAQDRRLSRSELDKLRGKISADSSPAGRRDLALLEVLYYGGLRRTEAVNLNVADVDLKEGNVVVRGKGGRDRIVPIDGAMKPLKKWIGVRGPQEPLFVAIDKSEKVQSARLTADSVLKILHRRAADAGIEPFSPHDLRRTIATDMLQAGIPITVVQRHLGHQSVTTTSFYDTSGQAALKQAAKMMHERNGGENEQS
jgi:integrase/recombinase XerD